VIIRKLEGLPDAELRASRLLSGWTPLELLKHQVYMEQRWLRWGFRAEQFPDPHGDEDQAGGWHTGSGDTAANLIAALHAAGEQTRAIVAEAELAYPSDHLPGRDSADAAHRRRSWQPGPSGRDDGRHVGGQRGVRRGVGFYCDLVKANVERIVMGLSAELEDHPVAAVGVAPGWLRSEGMLENFDVPEDTWREACVRAPGFTISESPAYVGRGVAALARAADADRWAGMIVSSRQLADAHDVTDTTPAGQTAGATWRPTDGSVMTARGLTNSVDRRDGPRH
jgi:hypothetical protein